MSLFLLYNVASFSSVYRRVLKEVFGLTETSILSVIFWDFPIIVCVPGKHVFYAVIELGLRECPVKITDFKYMWKGRKVSGKRGGA